MRNAANLRVLETAMELAVLTYRATAGFPPEERFGLTSQMRRAAVSVGSNIAEGCGRSSELQLRNFLQMAGGSASELEFQTRLAVRLEFGDRGQLGALRDLTLVERRMIGRLSSKIRNDGTE